MTTRGFDTCRAGVFIDEFKAFGKAELSGGNEEHGNCYETLSKRNRVVHVVFKIQQPLSERQE